MNVHEGAIPRRYGPRQRGLAILVLTAALGVATSMFAAQPSLAGGPVLSWGDNSNHQLGIPSPGMSTVPVQVQPGNAPCDTAGLATATQVSAGAWHSLALVPQNGGEVCAWGRDTEGQLGDGNTTSTPVPQVVCAPYSPPSPCSSPLQNVKAVSAGGLFSLALVSSLTLPDNVTVTNAVVAFGGGYSGVLGNGTTASSDIPQLVCATVPASPYNTGSLCPDTSPAADFLTGINAISAGEYNALALTITGMADAWGDNSYCELGIGNLCTPPTPQQGPYTGGCNPFGTTSLRDCSVDPVTVQSSVSPTHR